MLPYQYGLVEVMGHQAHAGELSEVIVAGQAMIRVTAPEERRTEVLEADRWVSYTDVILAGTTVEYLLPALDVVLGAASVFRMSPLESLSACQQLRRTRSEERRVGHWAPAGALPAPKSDTSAGRVVELRGLAGRVVIGSGATACNVINTTEATNEIVFERNDDVDSTDEPPFDLDGDDGDQDEAGPSPQRDAPMQSATARALADLAQAATTYMANETK